MDYTITDDDREYFFFFMTNTKKSEVDEATWDAFWEEWDDDMLEEARSFGWI